MSNCAVIGVCRHFLFQPVRSCGNVLWDARGNLEGSAFSGGYL